MLSKPLIRSVAPIAVACAVAIPGVLLASYAISLWEERSSEELAKDIMPNGPSSPFMWPGVKDPPIVSAAEANLKDDDPIIGIEINGHFRAYCQAALAGVTGHVVNDLIQKTPVTVTYCDRADCARAFTSDQRGEALDVSTGGMYDGNLLLKFGGYFIHQPTGEAMSGDGATVHPLEAFPITRTIWKAWREKHPDTDVYVGGTPPPDLSKTRPKDR